MVARCALYRGILKRRGNKMFRIIGVLLLATAVDAGGLIQATRDTRIYAGPTTNTAPRGTLRSGEKAWVLEWKGWNQVSVAEGPHQGKAGWIRNGEWQYIGSGLFATSDRGAILRDRKDTWNIKLPAMTELYVGPREVEWWKIPVGWIQARDTVEKK